MNKKVLFILIMYTSELVIIRFRCNKIFISLVRRTNMQFRDQIYWRWSTHAIELDLSIEKHEASRKIQCYCYSIVRNLS